ncbi:MAG TPA: replication protein P [Saprospiraceae bacterium]|nr:replication protein P [Saprospiraceae bacterium]
MKKIEYIIRENLETIHELKKKKSAIDPLCAKLVEQIFFKLALICRGFDNFYADRDRLSAEKIQWELAFSRLGIRHKQQIERSLAKLELYKFPNPPQLGEFLEWRNGIPEDEGFPDVYKAYQISVLINQQFSDYKPSCQKTYTVIKHAIDQIGSLEYRSMPQELSRKTFALNYAVSCRQFLDGELKIIPKAITNKPESHPIDKVKADEARKKAMNALRGLGLAINRPM